MYYLQEIRVVSSASERAFNLVTCKMRADLNYISRNHYEVDISIFAYVQTESCQCWPFRWLGYLFLILILTQKVLKVLIQVLLRHIFFVLLLCVELTNITIESHYSPKSRPFLRTSKITWFSKVGGEVWGAFTFLVGKSVLKPLPFLFTVCNLWFNDQSFHLGVVL